MDMPFLFTNYCKQNFSHFSPQSFNISAYWYRCQNGIFMDKEFVLESEVQVSNPRPDPN